MSKDNLDNKEIRKNIWRLAWPAILRMGFQSSVSIVTLFMVGNFLGGAESVAAIGLAQRVMFLVIGTMSALTIGTTALVAHYYGAEMEEKSGEVVSQTILIGLVVAILLAIILDIFGPAAIKLLMLGNPDVAVIEMGSSYLRVIGYSMIAGLIMMIINAGQQGAGDMKRPMYFTLGINISTVILSVILIPRLGLTGAGLAEGLSRAGGGITALVFLLRGKLVIKVEKEQFLKWQPAVVKRILHIGLPAAGEQLVRQSSQIVYTIIIASLGTVAIAANQVVMTVQMTSFMPGFGFGLAATTLVGQALGAKNPDNAERYGYETNKLAMIFMGVMGVIFFVWAEPLASFFVTDQEIVDLAALCLRVVAFAQIPFSAVMVISGGLRGAGDTRWVMYLTAGGQWGIRLVLSFILIWGFGFNLVGAWIAMLLDVLIRGFMTLLRYRSGKWKNILTIKQEKEPQVRFLESQ
jgi:putative MATE family efflux protein